VGKHSLCAMKCSDRMDGKSLWLCQEASEPLGLSVVRTLYCVSSMPLKGTGEARGKLPRCRPWLRNHRVSPNEAGFDLREISPLSQYLARWDSNRVRKGGRDWLPDCTSQKDAKGYLNYPLVGWDSAKSGLGQQGNRHLRDFVESVAVNMGDSSDDAKESGSRGLETTPENLRCV
jgi:hypothetical protein